MRAATVAKCNGCEVDFSLAGFRAAFAEGADLAAPRTIAALAPRAGCMADGLLDAIGHQDVKDELRTATERAHALGVTGIPTLRRVGLGDASPRG